MDTVQREKLVEAMMNDILKSMRAIEKRKREESEEQPEKNDEEGPTTPMSIDTEKPVDERLMHQSIRGNSILTLLMKTTTKPTRATKSKLKPKKNMVGLMKTNLISSLIC